MIVKRTNWLLVASSPPLPQSLQIPSIGPELAAEAYKQMTTNEHLLIDCELTLQGTIDCSVRIFFIVMKPYKSNVTHFNCASNSENLRYSTEIDSL